MAKIIQITAGEGEYGTVFALTDEGVVLKFVDAQDANGRHSQEEFRGRVGYWTAYWKVMPDISVTEPRFVPLPSYEGRIREEQVQDPY